MTRADQLKSLLASHIFAKEKNNIVTNEMKIHPLQCSTEALQSLGSTQVEMKITLSYLIEPNPSARPSTSRYRYESHSLRFDVKRSTESEQDFREHINQLLKEETDDERVRLILQKG
ncbi:MAG: hypothetical protein F4099_01120 [Synechococcus sp. SB0673_bin_10]|nr:hypothetical protein [Synechococcus sp. SB0675_bin_7]MYI71127.1 hypothetical protein [Synechococcus sp. SB0673_bin_10]MYK86054.1 hypothetical protein [Synechococcus sp. SB0669_bin_7]